MPLGQRCRPKFYSEHGAATARAHPFLLRPSAVVRTRAAPRVQSTRRRRGCWNPQMARDPPPPPCGVGGEVSLPVGTKPPLSTGHGWAVGLGFPPVVSAPSPPGCKLYFGAPHASNIVWKPGQGVPAPRSLLRGHRRAPEGCSRRQVGVAAFTLPRQAAPSIRASRQPVPSRRGRADVVGDPSTS
jgi:hypothetical protein